MKECRIINKLNVKVIKNTNDTNKPDTVEINTIFSIGQKIDLKYDLNKKKTICSYGSISTENKTTENIGTFEITDILCNMLVYPHENMIELKSLDEKFLSLYPNSEYMTVFENVVLNKLVN